MRHLRGLIENMQGKTIKCLIARNELSEDEITSCIKDGEHKFSNWLPNLRRDSLTAANQKLIDHLISLRGKEVLIELEDGKIIDAERVYQARQCHFCRNFTFRSDFAGHAFCNKPCCYSLAKLFCSVTRVIDGYQPPLYVTDSHLFRHEYLSNGVWENSPYSLQPVEKTKITYQYRVLPQPICKNCFSQGNVEQEAELLKHLQHQYEESGETTDLYLTSIPERKD